MFEDSFINLMRRARWQHVIYSLMFLMPVCWWLMWPCCFIYLFILGECPGGLKHTHTPLSGWFYLSIQINGVDMTEARHDQAVALLTGTSPTIALLVERDLNAPGGSPGQSRARAHSPPPPEPSYSPDQEEEGLSPHGNHLTRMEDEYPIEVRRQSLL